MATPSQLTANRENSPLSTGPVMGAGLSSTLHILPDENKDEYQALFNRLTAEMQPCTEHEGFLVGLMAQARWKLGRIAHLEEELLTKTLAGEPVTTVLSLMMRYSSAAERSYYKAHKEFMQSRRTLDRGDRANLNKAVDAYLKAPPGQAKGFAINIRQPFSPAPPRPAHPESASFGKIQKSAAATLGNLALRL